MNRTFQVGDEVIITKNEFFMMAKGIIIERIPGIFNIDSYKIVTSNIIKTNRFGFIDEIATIWDYTATSGFLILIKPRPIEPYEIVNFLNSIIKKGESTDGS
jgi:hypothetical protein